MIKVKNFFHNIPENLPGELIEKIVDEKSIKIERIISKGHITENRKWYNQDKNEFVLVLEGNAVLLFEEKEKVRMKKGDYLTIPKNTKHRVIYTDKNKETIWLSVFY